MTMSASKYVQCRGCGKTILRGRPKFCRDCMPLHLRLRDEHIPPSGVKSFWASIRKYGHTCRLSGVALETNDYTSPWYLVFSRLVPGNNNKILPAAALFNGMKSALVVASFKRFVINLDDHRKKHAKVMPIPVPHWRLSNDTVITNIARRMKHERFPKENIKEVLDYLRQNGCVDYYTQMPLDVNDPQSPWYLVFDHWRPRDPARIVVTSALVNEMKGDLTEAEFWYFIGQLARYFRSAVVVRKRSLECWDRPYRLPQMRK